MAANARFPNSAATVKCARRNERPQFLRRGETAQRLQGCGRVRGGQLVARPGRFHCLPCLRRAPGGDEATHRRACIAFPIALALSYAFEITPEGIKRESEVDKSIARRPGRKIVATTVVLAAIAGGLLAWQLLRRGTYSVAPTASDNKTESTESVPPMKSIAVLPFENLSDDSLAEVKAHAGLTNDAVDILGELLAAPAGQAISSERSELDPVWAPIRNDPKFQQLLTMKEHVGP